MQNILIKASSYSTLQTQNKPKTNNNGLGKYEPSTQNILLLIYVNCISHYWTALLLQCFYFKQINVQFSCPCLYITIDISISLYFLGFLCACVCVCVCAGNDGIRKFFQWRCCENFLLQRDIFQILNRILLNFSCKMGT